MAKQPKVEARQRENEDLYDFFLMSGNGEHLLGEWQGRPPGNVKRDFARIKKAMASAELVIVKREIPAAAE